MIRKICEHHRNTYFINTESAFLNSGGLPRTELFVGDNLHLNSQGYKIWADIIKRELDRVLVSK
jgi:lysophospholipase L1-like esterase